MSQGAGAITNTGTKRPYDQTGTQNDAKRQKIKEACWLPNEVWQLFSTHLLEQNIDDTMKDVHALSLVNRQVYCSLSSFNYLWQRLQERHFHSAGNSKSEFLEQTQIAKNIWNGNCIFRAIDLGEARIHSSNTQGDFLYIASSDKAKWEECSQLKIQKWDYKKVTEILSYSILFPENPFVGRVYIKDDLLFLINDQTKEIAVHKLDSGEQIANLEIINKENIKEIKEIQKQDNFIFVFKTTIENKIELEKLNLNSFATIFNLELTGYHSESGEFSITKMIANETNFFISYYKDDAEYIEVCDLTKKIISFSQGFDKRIEVKSLAVYDNSLYSFITSLEEASDDFEYAYFLIFDLKGTCTKMPSIQNKLLNDINNSKSLINSGLNTDFQYPKFGNLITFMPLKNFSEDENPKTKAEHWYLPIFNTKSGETNEIFLNSNDPNCKYSFLDFNPCNGHIFIKGTSKNELDKVTEKIFILDFKSVTDSNIAFRPLSSLSMTLKENKLIEAKELFKNLPSDIQDLLNLKISSLKKIWDEGEISFNGLLDRADPINEFVVKLGFCVFSIAKERFLGENSLTKPI